MTVLALGFENGTAQCLRIKTEKLFEEYEDFCVVKRHFNKITGLALDHRLGMVA